MKSYYIGQFLSEISHQKVFCLIPEHRFFEDLSFYSGPFVKITIPEIWDVKIDIVNGSIEVFDKKGTLQAFPNKKVYTQWMGIL